MENTQLNPTATLQINEIKTNQKSHLGLHENAATTSRRKTHRKRTRDNIKAVHQQKKVHVMIGGDSNDDDDEDLDRKVVALQRIVPGGETLGVDKLFEETADYILTLQCQIKAMKVLINFIESLEKEKRKFGA